MSEITGRKLCVFYSSRKICQRFPRRPRIAPVAVAQKSVDSSSVSQKACPALVFERWLCGKAEEGFGKKGDEFFK
jgi:hypothetical protein